MSIPPSGHNSPPDTPPLHPGRMVDPHSATAAFLRYAGLSATDVAPGADAVVWVSMDEAQAEADRRGITVEMPAPLPAPSREEALFYVRPMLGLGAHLIKLHPGRKNPVQNAWQDFPPLSSAKGIAGSFLRWVLGPERQSFGTKHIYPVVRSPEPALNYIVRQFSSGGPPKYRQ